MGPVIDANPFRCRMWALHDRLDAYLSEETCKRGRQYEIGHCGVGCVEHVPSCKRHISRIGLKIRTAIW